MEIQFEKIISSIPFLRLNIDYPYTSMLKEAQSLKSMYVAHRSAYERHTGWKSLCIHGLSPTMTDSHEVYGYSNPYDVPYIWTDVASFTQNWFMNNFPTKKFFRIRFMLLESGGFIEKHIDNNRNKLGPVNMALNNPDNCNFVMNDIIVPFKVGTAFMLNVSNEHYVKNESNIDRYHIIVHHEPNEEFKKIVEESYEENYK